MSSATSQNDHTAMNADDLYELISDRATDGKPPIRTSNGATQGGHYLFANHVVAKSLPRPTDQHQQGRGLAGSGSASLGAGYHQPDVALVVDALVVTAASRPRGTAWRGSTPT